MESSGTIRVASRALTLAIAFALGTTAAPRIAAAGNITLVENCDDDGPGSLRAAAAVAVNGGTIDLTGLDCGTIELQSGEITLAQPGVYLEGPGMAALTISGGFGGRVFNHSGNGQLAIHGVTIAEGKYFSNTDAYGGCISSSGTILLEESTVRDCMLVGGDQVVAMGGGLRAFGDAILVSSRVTGNSVTGQGPGVFDCEGGGLLVNQDLTVKYSTIDNNSAFSLEDGDNCSGGGAVTFGSALVFESTLSNNASSGTGGISISSGGAATFIESTISGNHSTGFGGGIYSQSDLEIWNSTIALNYSGFGEAAVYRRDGPITLQSTIIAGNWRPGGVANDLGGNDSTIVTGSNNIITSSSVPVPPDTLTGCPRLGALDDHGGPTLTHALSPDSIAIDAGNNLGDHEEDQRGMPRVVGAAADVGAVERAPDDGFAFHSGFEARCEG
jgi:predicted outer membrane repeat protein